VDLVHSLARRIEGRVKVINFCGTHEHTVSRYGLRSLMPSNVELVAGPGCPVCVTPSRAIEYCIKLATEGFTIITFGDVVRVPTIRSVEGMNSLLDAKRAGYDVRIVYSFLDATKIARELGKQCIFLAIGFETTVPGYASLLSLGKVPRNLLIMSVARLTPPIMRYVVELHRDALREERIGVIAPGHVSTIVGASTWSFLPQEYGVPTVVAGFEPLDVLVAIAEILRMFVEKRIGIVNEYRRAVTWNGNLYARKLIEEVFEVVDAWWRGIGMVPSSGLVLRDRYREWCAYRELGLEHPIDDELEVRGCRCGDVLLGLAKPVDCPNFGRGCRPEHPLGPCMVSSEGSCRIWYEYGAMLEI